MRCFRRCAVVALALGVAGLPGPVPAVSASEPVSCRPVVLDAGGTYGGCYRSTDPDVPAVTITTTEPVRVAGATIQHAGEGVVAEVDRVRLVVEESTFVALDPHRPEPVSQRAITAWRPREVVVEHDRFVDGHGIWLGADGDTATRRLAIRFNESIDVGRYGHPTEPNCCVQFVQLDHLVVDGDIGWNRTANHAGRSSIEDNINLYRTRGRSAIRAAVEAAGHTIGPRAPDAAAGDPAGAAGRLSVG